MKAAGARNLINILNTPQSRDDLERMYAEVMGATPGPKISTERLKESLKEAAEEVLSVSESTDKRLIATDHRSLPVVLTEAEVLDRARNAGSLAAEAANIDGKINSLKEEVKALVAGREKIDMEVRRLNGTVHTGVEHRIVMVMVEAHLNTNTVQEIRVDTHEIIKDRPMTPEEAQGDLFEGDDPK